LSNNYVGYGGYVGLGGMSITPAIMEAMRLHMQEIHSNSEEKHSDLSSIEFNFKNLDEVFKCAIKNVDKENGAAYIKSTCSDWHDNYSFNQYVKEYDELLHGNIHSHKEIINFITETFSKYVDIYKNHFVPQNVFNTANECHGSYVDMGVYVSGSPECMVNFEMPTKKKNINIGINIGGAGSKCNEIQMAGFMGYVLAMILKDRAFNLYGYYASTGGNKYVIKTFIPLITNSTTIIPINLELVLLNLRGFFRRIMFAVEESLPSDVRHSMGIYNECGYGSISDLSMPDIYKTFGIDLDFKIDHSFFSGLNLRSRKDIDQACKNFIEKIIQVM
jgi:hypothetical protein